MSEEDLSCPKCNRECQNKRGLSIHINKCGQEKEFICDACDLKCSTHNSLIVHRSRCKKILLQQIVQPIKEQIQENLVEVQEEKESLLQKLQDQEREYKQKLQDQEASHRQHLERALKLRDDDLVLLQHKLETVTLQYNHKQEAYETVKEELQESKRNVKYIQEQYVKLANKQVNTTIVNNTSNYKNNTLTHNTLNQNQNTLTHNTLNQNNNTLTQNTLNQNNNTVTQNNAFQLQSLEPSMIQGLINPPDYVVENMGDLMSMLKNQGVRNCFRVQDKSRKVIKWNKPGQGEIRDPRAEEMSNHIVDILHDDLIKEKVYYENRLKELQANPEPDLHEIQYANNCISFCNRLIEKEHNMIHSLKNSLAKHGRNKDDQEVDQVYKISYHKFTIAISLALFPKILEWIQMSPYELGRYIGEKTKDYYHVEGASRSKCYIVVKDDKGKNKMIKANKLLEFLCASFIMHLLESPYKETIYELLTSHPDLDQERIQEMIHAIETADENFAQEILRGIVSL
jgi:hypothetical protein